VKKPLALYLHLPFCLSKCHYCDFNSVVADSDVHSKYLQTVAAEMKYYAALPHIQGRQISSVYWGGGTPTILGVEVLAFLADELKSVFNVPEGIEWSVEANPGTIDRRKVIPCCNAGLIASAWVSKVTTTRSLDLSTAVIPPMRR